MIDLQKIYFDAQELVNHCKHIDKMCILCPEIMNKLLSRNDLKFFHKSNSDYSITGDCGKYSLGDTQILFANNSASLRARTKNTYSNIGEGSAKKIYAITNCKDDLSEIDIIYISENTPDLTVPSITTNELQDDGIMFQLSTIYNDDVLEYLVYNAVLNSLNLPRMRLVPIGVEMIWKIIKNSVEYEYLMKEVLNDYKNSGDQHS